jgi:hypothetical protein
MRTGCFSTIDQLTNRIKLAAYVLVIAIILFGLAFLPFYSWLAFFIWVALIYVAIAAYYKGTDLQRVTAISIALFATLTLLGLKSGYVNGLVLLAITVNIVF